MHRLTVCGQQYISVDIQQCRMVLCVVLKGTTVEEKESVTFSTLIFSPSQRLWTSTFLVTNKLIPEVKSISFNGMEQHVEEMQGKCVCVYVNQWHACHHGTVATLILLSQAVQRGGHL